MSYRKIIQCDKCKRIIEGQEKYLKWRVELDKEHAVEIHVCKECCLVLLSGCLLPMKNYDKNSELVEFFKRHNINPEGL